MALTIGEKVGAIAAFIPVVSTVSGLVQAIVYYNRTKNRIQNTEVMHKTAVVAHQIALPKLLESETDYNSKLWKASFAEMIPGVNLLAAVYSAFILNKLSKTREMIENSDKASEKILKDYDLQLIKTEPQKRLMLDVIALLDPNNDKNNPDRVRHYIKMSEGFIFAFKNWNQPPTAQQVLEGCSERKLEQILTDLKTPIPAEKPNPLKAFENNLETENQKNIRFD